MASLFSSPPPAGIAAQRPKGAGAGKGKSNALKRPAPRFLGDDDEGDNDDLATRLGRKKTTAEDIDKLFDDLDRVDEDGELGLPPPLKRPALDRPEASQLLLDDTITVGNKKKGKNGKDGEEGGGGADQKTRKPSRKRMIMNEERLLGDRGLRKLKDSLKGFKIKGKGHEEEDLRRLMSVYQIWAHQMFPGGTFRDTLESVEKLCHKRALQSQMRDWRDEARGIFRPKPTSEDATNHADINDDDNDTVEAAASTNRPAGSQGGASSPSGTTNPSSAARPKKSYFDNIPTSSPGGALGGGDAEMALPDLDEDDEDEAAYRQQRQSSTVGGGHAEDDDVFFGSQAPDTRLSTTSEAGFNDADLVFDLDDEPMGMDDEDDMAALLEMERDEESNPRPSAPAKAVPPSAKMAEPASQAAKKSVEQEEEDNLDDFDFPDEDEMMREMEAAARKAENRHQSKRETTSFYSAPSKPKDNIKIDPKAASTVIQPAKPAAKPAAMQTEDNFDDFDFGEEEDILREMEMAENTKNAAPPSLTTGSSSNASLDMDFELEEDEDFLKSIEEAESLEHKKVAKKGEQASALPVEMEEEEDLYS